MNEIEITLAVTAVPLLSAWRLWGWRAALSLLLLGSAYALLTEGGNIIESHLKRY